MKIKIPYIDNKHFKIMVALYDAKAAEYNTKVALKRKEGDKSAQFLKSAHREIFFELYRAYKGHLAQMIVAMRGDSWLLEKESRSDITVFTNRKKLSGRTIKSEATIYRLIMRLIDANIIVNKVNHGVQRDFELAINPDLVPISDHSNESYDPVREILQNTADTTIQATLRSICTPLCIDKNFENIFNNELITSNNQEHKKVSTLSTSFNEHSRTHYKNTGEPADCTGPAVVLDAPQSSEINTFKTNQNNKQNNKHLGSAKINTSYSNEVSRLNELQKAREERFAVMLVEYAISHLFNDKNIYLSERKQAYKNAQAFFKNVTKDSVCNQLLEQYQERIKLAQRFLERNSEFNFSNIYPAKYFDVENDRSGFVKTEQWYKKHLKYKELQFKTRQLKTEESIYNYALQRLMQNKNQSAFRYWRSYIINKAPNKLSQYESAALPILQLNKN